MHTPTTISQIRSYGVVKHWLLRNNVARNNVARSRRSHLPDPSPLPLLLPLTFVLNIRSCA